VTFPEAREKIVKKVRAISRPKKFSITQLGSFIIIFALIGGYILIKSFAASCSVASPGSTTDRRVTLNMSGCVGTRYFRVSESPDFGASSGVQVKINNVAADKSYADVSVTYPNGTPATGSTPFSLPPQPHTVKALAVIFTFDDANGNSSGLGAYQTTAWAQKLMFGGGSSDGVFSNNDVKDWISQSSNGQINLAGSVYPQVIHLPLEKYRQVLGSGGKVQVNFGEDILKTIQSNNPGYLDNGGFDFLVGLSADQYAVSRNLYPTSSTSALAGDYGNIKGYITYSTPVDISKSIFANTIQEIRTSPDANTVITRYNPTSGSIEGVWLASDTNRTGTNFYTGGSITQTPDTQFSYLKLGTALPNANTQVIVRYKAAIASQKDSSAPDQVSNYSWFSHFSHELQHAISVVPAYHFAQGGEDPVKHVYYDSPTLFSAYTRSVLGYGTPYSMQYGQNEATIRLYRAENGDPANNSRTSMVKVPLIPTGDEGLETRLTAGQQLTSTSPSNQYRGNEYLLLDWRTKGDNLENGMYNFDRILPSEGLVISHVIEAAPYGPTAASNDIGRVQDATPPNPNFAEGFSDDSSSPATFGPQSGVMSYTTSAYWQEKTPDNDTHSSEYLLSPGQGTKTLYVQFADGNGTITGTQQLSVASTADQQPASRMPTMSIDLADGTTLSSFRNIVATYTAPNRAKNIRFYIDGIKDFESSESNISQTSTSDFINPTNLTPGAHQLKVVLYDGGLNKVTASANFTTVGGGDTTPPNANISVPSNGSTVWGTIVVRSNSIDLVKTVKSELYIDNNLTFSTKGSVMEYNWYTTQVPNGAHTLMAKAYDAAGNVGTSSVVNVTVQNADAPPADTTPPSTPANLTATASAYNSVSLSWNASSDNTGVAGYSIVRNGTTIAQTSGAGTTYVDATVNASTAYSYQVMAYDANNNTSALSNAASVTTPAAPDTTPPAVPTNFDAATRSSTQIDLSWSASSDNIGVSGYDVYRSTTGTTDSFSKINTQLVTTTSYGDSGLSATIKYYYYVIARDSAGNSSAPSNTDSDTTQSPPTTTGNIIGTVSSSKGGVVAGVTVKLTLSSGKRATSLTTTTNSNGQYSLTNISSGSYPVSYSKAGFNSQSTTVSITANSTTTKNVTLVSKK
jgi:chitodextrinase